MNYAECMLNVPRRFTVDDIGTSGLARGWQQPTRTGLVNKDPEAVLDLLVRHTATACRLEVSGQPICRAGSKVGIACFANGRLIGYWHADAESNITMVADIEPEIFRAVPPSSYLQLVWHFTCWRGGRRQMEDVYFNFLSITLEENLDSPLTNEPESREAPQVVRASPVTAGEFTTDAGIGLLCMDDMVFPEISDDWYKFQLPCPLEEVIIFSNSSIPSEIGISPDERRLGIAVAEIVIGRRHVPLNHWSLRNGWHAPEENRRWTNGDARLLLPAKAATVHIRVAAVLRKYKI